MKDEERRGIPVEALNIVGGFQSNVWVGTAEGIVHRLVAVRENIFLLLKIKIMFMNYNTQKKKTYQIK